MLRYVDGPQLVGVKTAQPFIIGNIRVKAVKVKVLRQVYQILHAPCVVSQDKSGFKGFQSALIPYFQQGVAQLVQLVDVLTLSLIHISNYFRVAIDISRTTVPVAEMTPAERCV